MTQPTTYAAGNQTEHLSVMREELVDAVLGDVAGRYIDATFGRGGHARALLEQLGPNARLLVMDRDLQAIEEARRLCSQDSRVCYAHARFAEIRKAASENSFENVDGVMFDVGVSSPQIDQAERGFSFRFDGPLDMRMDTSTGITAQEWLNSATRADMARVFRDYGEERNAYGIAGAIERARPVTKTLELAEIVESAQGRPDRHKHAATRVFQAIRIFINDELTELRSAIDESWELLRPKNVGRDDVAQGAGQDDAGTDGEGSGGKLAVISFHSLEDRIVKRAFKALVKPSPLPRRLPVRANQEAPPKAKVMRLQKARDTEVVANPRARSAVLRVAERLL